jgi:hypothetical protein
MLIESRWSRKLVRIPNWFWSLDISDKALRVGVILLAFEQLEYNDHPYIDDIADKAGCGYGTVQRALRELKEVGMLRVEAWPGHSNCYTFLAPPRTPPIPRSGPSDIERALLESEARR